MEDRAEGWCAAMGKGGREVLVSGLLLLLSVPDADVEVLLYAVYILPEGESGVSRLVVDQLAGVGRRPVLQQEIIK